MKYLNRLIAFLIAVSIGALILIALLWLFPEYDLRGVPAFISGAYYGEYRNHKFIEIIRNEP